MFMYTMGVNFLPDDFASVYDIPTPEHDKLNHLPRVRKVVCTKLCSD